MSGGKVRYTFSLDRNMYIVSNVFPIQDEYRTAEMNAELRRKNEALLGNLDYRIYS